MVSLTQCIYLWIARIFLTPHKCDIIASNWRFSLKSSNKENARSQIAHLRHWGTIEDVTRAVENLSVLVQKERKISNYGETFEKHLKFLNVRDILRNFLLSISSFRFLNQQ